jgi:cell division protein FtsB
MVSGPHARNTGYLHRRTIISDKRGESMIRHPMRLIGIVVGFSFAVGLAGCDYWPPALQAEIEQLRAETQTLTMEKTQLQAQVTDLSKTKQELQGQVDELNRMNREKTGMLTSLQNQLETSRARALKAMAQKAPHKVSAKPTGKATRPASKRAPKSSMAVKPPQNAVGIR